MKITIWHNIMWSRYKAVVFSAIFRQAQSIPAEISFYQIAETDTNRAGLSPVDRGWHQYPFTLIFSGSYSKIPILNLLTRLSWLTFKNRADVTILSGYERPEVWLQALILVLKRQRFAVFCDSTIYDRNQTFLKGIAKRIFFFWCHGIFCYGTRAMEYVRHYGVTPEKIFVRCQAAALPKSYTVEKALELRRKNAPRNGNLRYLYVGRLSPEKSLDHLLEAFRQVVEVNPACELIVVGKGPSLDDLKKLAAELGIEKNVVFAGPQYDDDLFEQYSKASCLVLPSHSEPWGLVVNEALSYGCPAVVSYRCGCVPELILDQRTGFTFEWGNTNELADKMKAVPEQFFNIESTARICIDHISPYSPDNAARSILEGCLSIERGLTRSQD